MPTYDYTCRDCGYAFEEFQNMSDEPLTICPKCGGTVKRMIGGGIGIIFKGNGFYVTDNRTDSKRDGAAPGSAADTVKKDTVKKPSAETSETAKSASGSGSAAAAADKKESAVKKEA